MSTKLVDALIVGAGPAGSSAAISLRKLGLSVLVIESNPFPRDRPGETLHPGIEPLFGQLGVLNTVNERGFLRHSHIRHMNSDTEFRDLPYGSDLRGDWCGYQIPRRELDRILLDLSLIHI